MIELLPHATFIVALVAGTILWGPITGLLFAVAVFMHVIAVIGYVGGTRREAVDD